MVRFLSWLDQVGPAGDVTEMEAAANLESLRAEGQYFQGLSFPTIAGFGPNGAIIHYHPTEATNRRIKSGGMLLLDSGAQYLDGTTDITRTMAIGKQPSVVQKRNFTRVLSGHIALATARFPAGATGARLDTLARQFLWQDQCDYAHGTGHGVGAFLNVHEGPQSISHRPQTVALEPGNIQSNEPGYYEPGRYGIRIENLVEVVSADSGNSEPAGFLELETLTLCPIDTSLIDLRLLSDAHRRWLNRYHARVRRTLSPLLDPVHKRWLIKACRSI
jgi:Xaa-Pro aminopeptidase